MSTTRVVSLDPKTPETAESVATEYLEKAQQTLGFIPNMYANFANHPAFYKTYVDSYNLFREQGGFTPVEQEVIFLTISRENLCTYCVGAHSFIADNVSKVPVDVTNAIRDGEQLADQKLNVLSQTAAKIVEKRGFLGREEVQEFVAAGFAEEQLLGIVLAVSVKTLSNYGNHLFDSQLDDAFSSRAWTPVSESF